MGEEKKSIFRKQALSRVSSPEELDKYLLVTGPGIWFTMIAIVVLLCGFIVWMSLGHLYTTDSIEIEVAEDGSAKCYVLPEFAESVVGSKTVKIGDAEYEIKDAGYQEVFIESASGKVAIKPLLVVTNGELEAGTYIGEITIEKVNPIKFIIN